MTGSNFQSVFCFFLPEKIFLAASLNVWKLHFVKKKTIKTFENYELIGTNLWMHFLSKKTFFRKKENWNLFTVLRLAKINFSKYTKSKSSYREFFWRIFTFFFFFFWGYLHFGFFLAIPLTPPASKRQSRQNKLEIYLLQNMSCFLLGSWWWLD